MSEYGAGSGEVEGGRRKGFICGVVEGFYGRPWTTEQRKDLFQKMKKWGMDTYVYAPKDDYKHRAYWRELYTVEEAEHLTSLIAAAKAQGVTFCYALSPGLDITYSNQKEMVTLKRKLEQVSQFGCVSFALLFDDIDTEMSEADKQIFQSFAHAQVTITNEIHQHLGRPQFLLCPTQYCSTRAAPDVSNSEYLNTLGTKLSQEIHIMWTGSKVISKTLTTECIEEITQVLRRPPVIWDNLHANDYDQKRVFLGPYCGRSPELIPLLRGVLTNPNCEYNANMVAVYTLAHWARCSLNAPTELEAVSWDIRLERESELGVAEESPLSLGADVYHPRRALRRAIDEWLPEFSVSKEPGGPVVKPQLAVAVAPVPIIPIMPSVNTCMSLVTAPINTSTTSTAGLAIPTVNTSQLRALTGADRPATSTAPETFNPVSNPIMNSLVSPTTVVTNDSLPNPIAPLAGSVAIPSELPVSTLPVPIVGLKGLGADIRVEGLEEKQNGDRRTGGDSAEDCDLKKAEELEIVVDDADAKAEPVLNGTMSIGESPLAMSPSASSLRDVHLADSDVIMADGYSENGSMQVEPSSSPVGSDMMVEPADTIGDESVTSDPNAMTAEDLVLLCELFYLPFEHGERGLRLLHDMQWLVTHAATLLQQKTCAQEASEWRRRRCRFAWWCSLARRLCRRLHATPNRELSGELRPYVWELCAVLALLDGFGRWLELGKFPPNVASYALGTYTWFSKGWREAFESGSQEPWVFRGGLTADLRRLLPTECGSAELAREPAALPAPLAVRPCRFTDEERVFRICRETCLDGSDGSGLFPADLQTLPADRLVAPFLSLSPELCMVIEDCSDDEKSEPGLVGYACAALDATEFYRRQEAAWLPVARDKYPETLLQRADLGDAAKEYIRQLHAAPAPPPASVRAAHPALLRCGVSSELRDPQAPARLLLCCLAALRANGVSGVHVCIGTTDTFLHQFYSKMGFQELQRDVETDRTYLGRAI